MSKIHTVVRHGKRIVVEELGPPKSSRRGVRGHFAKVDLQAAADIAKTLSLPLVLIVPLLIHLAWKTKSTTFPLPNHLLTRYGVSRWAKYRGLRRLEKAGLISVRNAPGKTTGVTLLVASERLPSP